MSNTWDKHWQLTAILLLTVNLWIKPLNAQNLIPNPRFEQISDCQQALGGRTPIELAPPWFNPNGIRYDDSYLLAAKVCIPPAQWSSFYLYGFISTYAFYQVEAGKVVDNKAAYASAPLIQPLQAAKYYWFSARAILSTGGVGGATSQEQSSYGLLLSSNRPAYPNTQVLPLTPGSPQLIFTNRVTKEPYTNKDGYTDNIAARQLLQGCFQAQGNEQYITIGDFLHGAYTKRNSQLQFTDLSLTQMPDAIDLGPDQSICQGQSLQLKSTISVGQYKPAYRWQDGSTDSTLSVTKSGLYSLTVTCSCRTYSDSIRIEVRNPNLQVKPDTSICQGNPITLTAGAGFDHYQWSDGSSLPTLLVSKPGMYRVAVERLNCLVEDSIRVYSSSECCQLELPTAFTPNGDGLNEQFGIYTGCSDIIQALNFVIYNRWGEIIFISHSAGVGWNGTYQGSPCEAGAYSWQLTYTLPAKRSVVHRTQHGTVLLIH